MRDLGGLRADRGRSVRWGALVRADAVDRLTAAGWSALVDHGVRTIIDLRNDDELRADVAPRPPAVTTVHLPLDGVEDRQFWRDWASGPQYGTPLYYGPFLERFPERAGRVVTAVARARAGGVLVHCMGGRDRTGLVTMLLLALVGVAPDAIAADYQLSTERLAALYARAGEEDQGPALEAFLASRGMSAREAIIATLASLDREAFVRDAGIATADLDALRDRLT